ncbi:YSIRK-type signal peptide-containing protein [Limosilactobacillus reuteri]|uniref:YSIRK-type signal peptide-containing protein n=1 Tax=Limosilactobacillus reuteri TaxID=1598 RepID=A0A517D368_LIMRT|nr:Rib/alpha-like domain-containing protein [Limosilactobacillus reuteri]QDR71697.1 YSIRK-type signal peptide-containing protein [Limosilactobacillus reuteri]
MLSKNNRKEQLLKQEPKKQRFTIKKLTIGVASVLIGFTFMGMNASADATIDTHSNTANQEAIQTNVDSGSKTLNNEQTNSSNSVANGSTNNTVSNDANNQNLVTSQGIDQNKITQNTTTEPAQNSQVQSVSDYSQFLNALQSANVSTIKLNQNIDFSNANLNNGSYQDINNYGIARTVTIDGQNQYALNMGNNYIDLDSNTYYEPNASNPTRNWNVILKDLNLQTTSGYGPFWFNSATSNDSTLTFNGVTTSKDSGQLLNNSTASSYPNVNVNFEGQNKLQGSLNNSNITSSALIQANNVNFSNGSTVFTANNNISSDLADIEASGNVVVDGSAQVDFSSEATSNMAGISFAEGGAGNQTIDNATSGVLRLMPNAQVTMELGSGASMGVNNASNLDLQDNSSLKITTSKMNSTGFRSAGLVGLDYDGDTNDSTVRISPNAVLSVIRTNVTNSDAPLLAMGPRRGNGEIYHLEVNSGSLNLQDSAYSSYLPSSYTLSKSQYWGGWPAILTMWGTSSQNYINFNNAKLINLQRTAPNKPGYLIKTEGAGDYAYHQTHIVINSPDSAYNTPLTIIPAGETKPVTWNVKYLNNTSQGGDYAYAFRSHRKFGAWNNAGSEYMNGSVNDNTPAKGINEVILTPSASDPGSNSFANGAVVPEGSETKASKALNNFINHFSWWNASGVKFGSSLDEKNQYTPSYKPVTVEQGQSATDDPSFTDQDGKDVTAPTGTTFAIGTDKPGWATINSSTGTVTVKPGTDVTPGAYNVPVIVTYSDKSTDDTTVPVIITKAGQTVTWGDNGAVITSVDTSKLNAHETTKNSQVLSAAGVVTAEGYELTDGKLSTTATPITINPSTVSWTTTPDTNVETATASSKEITTSVSVDFTNNDAAKNILGSKNGAITTNPFTIDAKGAGAKSVTAPVDIKLGSDLTSEQFGQLVDNNIPTDEIAKTEWATKPNEKGQDGVIKITFTDKAANGQPTYLNINIPASSIKVTTDAETNTPQGQDVSTKVGEVPDPAEGIKNKRDLPSGTKYTWQTTPDTTKPGNKPAVVVVTYPDGSKDTVPTNIVVNATPEIKTITTTVGGDPVATEGIANLNNGGTTPVDGYPTGATWTTKPDTSKPGATTGTARVTYPDGTTETVTIPVAVNGQGDVTVIDNGHVFSLHANDVITHKTSDKNIIGGPVIESFKLSYYQGGQNYSKPYIYTLNSDKTAYVLTQTGDNPAGVTVDAPKSINASDIKISWTKADTVLFNNALGAIKGNGQPTSLASENNGGTKTITYTNWVNNQFGYPKYSAVVNSSSVNWPIYGKGPVSTYPFPSVYIYGAEANGTIPSVYSDTTDLKAALGDASKLVNTKDLTIDPNAEISSIDWQDLPKLTEANAKAPATVRINFTDGSYLDVPVNVNVIKVDHGVDDKTNHDIYRDITRTINIQGESAPVVQHVIYSRAKITDLSKPTGQQISYTDWAAAKNSEGQVVTNFPQYEVTKPGYTAIATGATIETIDGKQYVPASGTITEDSNDETVNVTYTANEHTLVINYIDGNGTVVGTYNVPGKTDETVNVDVPGNVPTNWKLVPNQQVIGTYKFGSNDPKPVNYKVEHGTEVVPVDKNNKDSYRKITQTIYEIPAGKTDADKKVVRTASVEFERTGVKDLVTGKIISWNAWNSNSETFPVYNIKEQKGYDSYVNGAKATEVAAVTVNPDSSDITDTITYVKQAATPVPYDPSNKDMNMSVTRIINYEVPAGHDAIAPVTQTVEYTRNVDGVAGYQDPVTGEITWNAWHVKSGNAEFASAAVEQIKGYNSYVDGKKATEVPAAQVTEKDGVPQNGANVTVSYQKQGDTPVPYKPGQEGVNDDMNQYVTRTIVVHEPGKDPVSHDQTVHFTREDAQGNAGYTDPVTGETTWNAWHVAGELNQANGTWVEFNAPTVKGYTPSQANVAAEEVTAETKDVTVDINYAPVAPTGQNVTTKIGEVPDADQGIANKGDLPDGTKYSWKTTPDVSTEGNKPAVVVVTYPGGSTVEVPVTVTVTKNPTDADKYTPEGQDVNTKTGVVPNPAEGIKNKGDLPDGTKYTWKDTPDVTTEGNKPAVVIVTYPDGSKDEVPVTIHVTNPATDADKYTPEGQDVNTKTGVVPNPAEGIKNKSDLPDGTKYTWKDTPDVTTAGDKPATVVVTYPDGSKDEVPVTIHVTNPATDADKYTPETQPITTPEGKVPDPADGIKNKADLPDGTKYTWTNPDQVAQDVKTPGSHTETITVTYPDGSKDTVTVTVNVPAPEGQNITTDQGKLPNPADAIKNKDQMPDGTTYTWKQEPDVSTPGDHTGVVEVHFPDGTTSEVTVDVHVDAVNPDNGGNMNSGNGSIDHQNGTEINNGNMTNANNGSVIENVTGQTQNSATNSTSQQPAKTLPQTGNDSSKFSALAGLSLAAFASLFGFAGHDKKRKADK